MSSGRGRINFAIKYAFFGKWHFSDGAIWRAVLVGKTRVIRPKSGAEKRRDFVSGIETFLVFYGTNGVFQ